MKLILHLWPAGRLALLAAVFALATLPLANADSATPADQPILHLSETAQRDVPRDLLRATLAVEASDPDPAKVQANINQRMAAALSRVKQVASVTVETGGYGVYRESTDKAPARWHGSQSLTLSGKDFAALLALAGALQQQGMVMEDLSPGLSREGREAVEDSLTKEALTRLRQRADRVAAALGTKVAGLRSLTVGNVSPPPVPVRAMTAMASAGAMSAPPPSVAAGSATVAVTVSGDIALAPRAATP